MINPMNTAQKLRFLADRAEDGKKFLIYLSGLTPLEPLQSYIVADNNLFVIMREVKTPSSLSLQEILLYDFELKPQWTFIDDEKAILRNIPEEFNWIVRDKDNCLYIYSHKPRKGSHLWMYTKTEYLSSSSLQLFNHLFQSIQWEDDEPCEFRRYL